MTRAAFPVRVRKPQVGGRPVQLSDTPYSGATWGYASRVFNVEWKNPGGDWRDAAGVAQGAQHYASVLLPNVLGTDPPLTPVQVDVTELAKALQRENTGIHCTGPGRVYIVPAWVFPLVDEFAEHGRVPNPNGPQLSIVTDTGTYLCYCIAADHISSGRGYPYNGPEFGIPMLLKFDQSKVTGVIQRATLQFHVVYFGGFMLALNLLDMPRIVTNPETEIGGVRLGIANEVASDAELKNHPDVLSYSDLIDADAVYRDFNVTEPMSTGGVVFERDPKYGFTWAHCHAWAPGPGETGGGQRNVAWHKFAQPVVAGKPYTRPFEVGKALGYDEIYLRYMFLVGNDLRAAFNELGMKLPGLAGYYGWGATPGVRGWWECRLWHSMPNTAHPHLYRGATYYYSAQFGYSAQILYYNKVPFCFEAEQGYSVEQHIKLNTVYPSSTGKFTLPGKVEKPWTVRLLTEKLRVGLVVEGDGFQPGTRIYSVDGPEQITLTLEPARDGTDVPLTFGRLADADGIYQVSINGVLVDDRADMLFREFSEIQIHDWPFVNLYHGGMHNPKARYHESLASFVVSQKYIGPPKRIAP